MRVCVYFLGGRGGRVLDRAHFEYATSGVLKTQTDTDTLVVELSTGDMWFILTL